jgi:hypothetical protein
VSVLVLFHEAGKATLDDLCTRLADIAGIPPAKVNWFEIGCRTCIGVAQYSAMQNEEIVRAAARDELNGIMKDAQRLHKRLARLEASPRPRQFGVAIHYLGDARERRVCSLMPDDRTQHQHEAMRAITAFLMPALSELAVDAKAAKRSLRGGRNDEHRPARELIVNLEHLAFSMGGSFGLNHHPGRDGPTGSLVDALKLLENHFPKGFFPDITSTLQRDLNEARRRAARRPAFGVLREARRRTTRGATLGA